MGDTKPVALYYKIVQGDGMEAFMGDAEPTTLRRVPGNPLMDGNGHWTMLVLDTTEGKCTIGFKSRKTLCAAAGSLLKEHPTQDKKPLSFLLIKDFK